MTRIEQAPVIAGRLDDACRAACAPIGPLVQMSPLVAVPATEETDVRLAFDGGHLYMGVRCFDREPHLVVATQMTRDAELDPDDRVEILIDTFHDRRNAYFCQMSAAGSKGDALVSRNGNGFDKPWDGISEGQSSIDEWGWSCEIVVEEGEFFDGDRRDVESNISWRPSARFKASIAYERNDVDLPEGRFDTHLGRARFDFVFSPGVTWQDFVQFDSESDSLGVNSRLRWILEPGRDVFVVFDESLQRADGSLSPPEQEFAFKIACTLRF